jgi:hypothetical protein
VSWRVIDDTTREGLMKSKALAWVALAGLAPILFGKTSRSETISHGVQPAPGNTIPQGSQAICQGVPDGIALIPRLRTGWAIGQPPSANIQLLFSDQPLACQELGTEGIGKIAQERCVSAWSFSILLPSEMQTPGVYTLADHQVAFQNSTATMAPSQGCGGCSGGGSGGSGGGGPGTPPGTVEIYSVTDQCITGRFQGLETGQIQPPPPELNGAFHAVRCVPGPAAAGDP